jgi:hypothetical protein
VKKQGIVLPSPTTSQANAEELNQRFMAVPLCSLANGRLEAFPQPALQASGHAHIEPS